MQNIYCGTPQPNDTRGHFLGRINGATVELWCAKCKAFHAVSIVDLVRGVVLDQQNGHEQQEQERRLLW